jgi:predicted CXXCH cytochrome family protein
LALALAALSVAAACSESTGYRIKRFFFDGVPKPGETPSIGYEPPPGRSVEQAAPQKPPARKVAKKIYSHTPYRKNRCAGCHSFQTGELIRRPEQGLCRSCHGLPRDYVYEHGPAAVNACLLCHHHHASVHPKAVLDEIPALCYRCHKIEDLTRGEHHKQLETSNCLECHDPHGGDDRFFLRRNEP